MARTNYRTAVARNTRAVLFCSPSLQCHFGASEKVQLPKNQILSLLSVTMYSIGDEAVVATNDDATLCKYQAVSKGYYQDPFLGMLIPSKLKNSMARKAPEINRGYFARSASIAYIVEQFIDTNPSGQIISLGAGYDTLYWRLKSSNKLKFRGDESAPSFKYVEIDMSPVVMHKMLAIRRNKGLHQLLASITYKGEGLHSDDYHLISSDLRQVDKTPLKSKLFDDCKLDKTKPTLCFAECVLVYMPIQDSDSLIKWLGQSFENLTVVNYEQCNMEDRFGEIMLTNMNARHCDLMGVEACKSLESQRNRFVSNGLAHTKAWTLSEILNKCLLPAAVDKMSKIEFLDEKELLEQLLDHYCIVIGSHKVLDWIPETQYWISTTTM